MEIEITPGWFLWTHDAPAGTQMWRPTLRNSDMGYVEIDRDGDLEVELAEDRTRTYIPMGALVALAAAHVEYLNANREG